MRFFSNIITDARRSAVVTAGRRGAAEALPLEQESYSYSGGETVAATPARAHIAPSQADVVEPAIATDRHVAVHVESELRQGSPNPMRVDRPDAIDTGMPSAAVGVAVSKAAADLAAPLSLDLADTGRKDAVVTATQAVRHAPINVSLERSIVPGFEVDRDMARRVSASDVKVGADATLAPATVAEAQQTPLAASRESPRPVAARSVVAGQPVAEGDRDDSIAEAVELPAAQVTDTARVVAQPAVLNAQTQGSEIIGAQPLRTSPMPERVAQGHQPDPRREPDSGPQIHIGHIDIVVLAPEPARANQAAPSAASDLANRHYLRRL